MPQELHESDSERLRYDPKTKTRTLAGLFYLTGLLAARNYKELGQVLQLLLSDPGPVVIESGSADLNYESGLGGALPSRVSE